MNRRLNSITKIEEFMVNSLLGSKDIPLEVSVLRLADAPDSEGIVIFPKSITVRFTGSVTEVVNRTPLVLERTLDFSLEISCQNQQRSSGHDYATYLLGACSSALLNRVPVNTGFEVVVPFTLERESFQGLTESSHFVYEQTWSIVIKEVLPNFNPDPCIARGDCSRLFPPNTNTTVLEGEVLLGNRVYHLKPSVGLDCRAFGGVTPDVNGNLVTIEDNSVVYLSSQQWEEGVTFLVKPLPETEDILVTARSSSGIIIRSDVYCWTGRTVLGIFAFLTNRGEMPEKVLSLAIPYAERVVIVDSSAVAFRDPSDNIEKPLEMKYGNLVLVNDNVTLNVGDKEYTKAYIPQFNGFGWLTRGTFKFLYDLWECDSND